MTADEYQDWLLEAQGVALPEATQAPEKEQKPDKRFRMADIPDPQHGNARIWGSRE